MTPRTYTDKQGNLREYGTGRLLRRARRHWPSPSGPAPSRPSTLRPSEAGGIIKPKPKPKYPNAKTYTRNGVLYNIGGGRVRPAGSTGPSAGRPGPRPGAPSGRPSTAGTGAPAKTLEQRVEELLAGYDSEIVGLTNQTAGEVLQDQRLGAFYDQQMSKMMGDPTYVSDPATQAYLKEAQRAGMATTQELNHGARLRAQEDIRDLTAQRAAARAQLMRELPIEDLQMQQARQEMSLAERQQRMAELVANREWQLNLAGTRQEQQAFRQQMALQNDAQAHDLAMAAADVGSGGGGGGGMTPTQVRTRQAKVNAIRVRAVSDAGYGPNRIVADLTAAGVPTANAVTLVARWLKSSLPQRWGRAKFTSWAMNLGLSRMMATRLANQVYGPPRRLPSSQGNTSVDQILGRR